MILGNIIRIIIDFAYIDNILGSLKKNMVALFKLRIFKIALEI
jgi:hypothetical protein